MNKNTISYEDIVEHVKCVVLNYFKAEFPQVDNVDQTNIFTMFKSDEVDVRTLLMFIEQKFDIEISEEEVSNYSTIDDIVKIVCNHLNVAIPDK